LLDVNARTIGVGAVPHIRDSGAGRSPYRRSSQMVLMIQRRQAFDIADATSEEGLPKRASKRLHEARLQEVAKMRPAGGTGDYGQTISSVLQPSSGRHSRKKIGIMATTSSMPAQCRPDG
jgi:hypothetical protein